jgi:hypothetical protein
VYSLIKDRSSLAVEIIESNFVIDVTRCNESDCGASDVTLDAGRTANSLKEFKTLGKSAASRGNGPRGLSVTSRGGRCEINVEITSGALG